MEATLSVVQERLKETSMTLETRLISNNNAFFTRETRQPLIHDEYQKQFETDLMTTKKPLTAPTV